MNRWFPQCFAQFAARFLLGRKLKNASNLAITMQLGERNSVSFNVEGRSHVGGCADSLWSAHGHQMVTQSKARWPLPTPLHPRTFRSSCGINSVLRLNGYGFASSRPLSPPLSHCPSFFSVSRT